MNICFITSNYPSKDSNANVFVEQLVNEIQRQGMNVSVVSPQIVKHHLIRGTRFLPTYELRSNGQYQYILFRPLIVSFGNKMHLLQRIISKINRLIIERCINRSFDNIDVLYGHFWSQGLIAANYAKRNNIPLFVACGEGDNAIEDMVNQLGKDKIKELAQTVTGVISVSSENKRKCIKYGLASSNIDVFPNAYDSSVFKYSKEDRINIRKMLSLKEDDILVGFVGSFIERKGPNRLIDALKKINDPNIKLILIGKPLPGEVDTSMDYEGLVFKGAVRHNMLSAYLSAMDIFCLPTLREGCCNAIVEALACGVPVVSSNLPFNDDILNDENSVRINPTDTSQIADAISKLKNNIQRRKNMHKQALLSAQALLLEERSSRILKFIQKQINKYHGEN